MNAFEWLVALRFLREGRMQSVLIFLGVTVGVAVVVFITALVNGLQSNIIQRTLSTQAHISLRAPEQQALRLPPSGAVAAKVEKRAQALKSLEQWQAWLAVLGREPGVSAVSPMVSGAGLAVRGAASKSIALMGVLPDQYNRIVNLRDKLKQGQFTLASGEVVIGTELADDLGIALGDTLRLTTQGARSDVFRVAGIFDMEIKDINRRWVLVNLRSAQSLLDLPGGVSQIDLKVAQLFEAEAIAQRLARRTGFEVESWMQTNTQLLTALRSQSASSSMIRVFVSLSVALAIASVLAVSIVQKQKEIGILRAMGTRAPSVLRIFLIQGGVVGLLGSLCGSVLATALLQVMGLVAKAPDGSPLFVLEVSPSLFISSALGATLIGLLAAAAPALRAARLDPVQAIRNG
ncbi:ABC transporter permease [Chitinimonas taiwanensis]|uniref:ABC transporter permease n=1 Tax=Chitinimonas taiwanensis TaxID=240412 RepID=UPI0035B1E100